MCSVNLHLTRAPSCSISAWAASCMQWQPPIANRVKMENKIRWQMGAISTQGVLKPGILWTTLTTLISRGALELEVHQSQPQWGHSFPGNSACVESFAYGIRRQANVKGQNHVYVIFDIFGGSIFLRHDIWMIFGYVWCLSPALPSKSTNPLPKTRFLLRGDWFALIACCNA